MFGHLKYAFGIDNDLKLRSDECVQPMIMLNHESRLTQGNA